ncbi:MAG TPA: alpha/beta hydrolase [Blastocatellia bacterium]|nr:alpha/beta hydrolase [Blastocatellia bacterium]
MKPNRSSLTASSLRIGRWVGVAVAVAILMAAAAYPIANWSRQPLNDAARGELLQQGQARAFVSTSLGVMHVRDSGPSDRPVVLLVHGGVVGGYAFENWREPLLDAGYRVIVPDLLGYGYSDRPNIPYTKEFYVTQLNDLLNGLGMAVPVNMIGASQGGGIVAAFAAAHPERVKSVGLLAPNGGGPVHVVSGALELPVIGDWVFGVFGPRVMQNMMARAYQNNPARDGMLAWMKEQSRYRGYGEGVLNSVRHTLSNNALTWQPNAFEAIGRSGVPVLAVWGTNDTTVPFSQSEELRSRIPQLRLVPLEGQGHAITFGQARAVLNSVIPFLDEANRRH